MAQGDLMASAHKFFSLGKWSLMLFILGCRLPAPDPSKLRFQQVENKKPLVGIFVDSNSQAAKPDGKSWATAFKTIMQGVRAARSGKKIYIAAGTYKNPQIELMDKHDIEFIGGYKAGELFEKDFYKINGDEWTVLDGDNTKGNLVEISGKARNIHFKGGFSFQNVNDGSAIVIIGDLNEEIDNITISRSRFLNNVDLHGGGAGVYIAYGRNIRLEAIQAHGNRTEESGGSIFAEHVYGLKILRGVFLSNQAKLNGGAIHVESSSYVEISEQVFENNHAQDGGACSIISSKMINLSHLAFEQNQAVGGGGLLISRSANVSFNSSTLAGNHACKSGGGASFQGLLGPTTLELVEFQKNQAELGGGLFFDGQRMMAQVKIVNALFLKNVGWQTAGGLVIVDTASEVSISNTLFEANQSGDGHSPIYLDTDNERAKFSIGPGVRYKNNASTMNSFGSR